MKSENNNLRKFRTQFNGVRSEYQGEMNLLPSETVPGQSLSVKEILQKFTRGVDPEISKVPSFEFTEDHEDYDSFKPENDPAFDLADATEIIAQSHLTLSEINKAVAEKRKEKSKPVEEKTAGDKGIPGITQ